MLSRKAEKWPTGELLFSGIWRGLEVTWRSRRQGDDFQVGFVLLEVGGDIRGKKIEWWGPLLEYDYC